MASAGEPSSLPFPSSWLFSRAAHSGAFIAGGGDDDDDDDDDVDGDDDDDGAVVLCCVGGVGVDG